MMAAALTSIVLTVAYAAVCLLDYPFAGRVGLFYLAALLIVHTAEVIHRRHDR